MQSTQILLTKINTFDEDHIKFSDNGFLVKPFESLQTLKHRAVIDLIKLCILEGREIYPILVAKASKDTYQRLDGFCRYWAYKELGKIEIPCFFGTQKGGQSGRSPFNEILS